MNSKETPKIALKPASKPKRILAMLVDVTLLYFLVVKTIEYFDVAKISPNSPLVFYYVLLTIYYHLILVIIPQRIFSQSLGKFIFGLKVVTQKKYERLSLAQSILHSLTLGSLSKSTVVNIR